MADPETPSAKRNDLLMDPTSGWAKLYVWGNSKVVQSSVIWVIVTPLCAKLLNAIYTHIGITFTIPINAVLLYFAAVLFAIASVLYAFFAPTIFKHAPTYSAFMLGQHSHLELKNWFHDLAKISKDGKTVIDPKRIQTFLLHLNGNANVTSEQMKEILLGEAGHALLDPFWWNAPTAERLPFLYEITAKLADPVHYWARFTASLCYWLGFGLISVVAVLNTAAMVKYLLRVVG